MWKLLENKRFTKRRDLNWTGDFPPHFKRDAIEMCVPQISNAASLLIKCGTRGKGAHLRKYLTTSLPPVSLTFQCYGYMRFWALDNLTKTINNENIKVRRWGCLARRFQVRHKNVMRSKYDTNDPKATSKDYTQWMHHHKSHTTRTAIVIWSVTHQFY